MHIRCFQIRVWNRYTIPRPFHTSFTLFSQQALEQINLHNDFPNSPFTAILQNPTDLARLRGHLQIDGEIILWAAFWAGVSSLMSGTSLDELISIPVDSVIDSGNSGSSNMNVINLADAGTLTNPYSTDNSSRRGSYFESGYTGDLQQAHNYNYNYTNNESITTRERSDSQMARDLQAEMDRELEMEASGAPNFTSIAAPNNGTFTSHTHNSNATSGVKANTGTNTSNILQSNVGSSTSGGIGALDFSALTSMFNTTTTANATANANHNAVATSSNANTMTLQSPQPDSVSHTAATTPYKPTSVTTTSKPTANVNTVRVRSDSEIARELQAEWDAEDNRMNNSNNLDFDMDASAFDGNNAGIILYLSP